MLSMANCISIARIVMALALISTKPLSVPFFSVYLACGISDILDGFVARRTGTLSKLGGKLDSAADLALVMVVAVLLYPYVIPAVSVEIVVWIVGIAIVRLLSMSVVYLRYQTFAILHTFGNKATGLLLFMFPFLLPFGHINMLAVVLCGVASLSALEELMIHLVSRELHTDRKSIFMK